VRCDSVEKDLKSSYGIQLHPASRTVTYST